jgi:hypothetical protein
MVIVRLINVYYTSYRLCYRKWKWQACLTRPNTQVKAAAEVDLYEPCTHDRCEGALQAPLNIPRWSRTYLLWAVHIACLSPQE